MKYIVALLMGYCLVFSAQAQPSISGYVYELQSGEPIEGVRVQFKNRQGLEIGTMQATYTDDEGYYEFANVKPRDYRAEITHVFDTENGPTRLRIFTLRNIISMDSTDYKLNIALSRLEAERAVWNRKFIFTYAPKKGKVPTREEVRAEREQLMHERFGDNWEKVLEKWYAERQILQSRMIDSNGKIFYGAMAEILSPEDAERVRQAAN